VGYGSAHRLQQEALHMSSAPRPIPVLDLVGAITLDPEFRMEDVLRALDSMTATELEEMAQLLDQHEVAVRRATWRAH
jgi:hypothetical protein